MTNEGKDAYISDLVEDVVQLKKIDVLMYRHFLGIMLTLIQQELGKG